MTISRICIHTLVAIKRPSFEVTLEAQQTDYFFDRHNRYSLFTLPGTSARFHQDDSGQWYLSFDFKLATTHDIARYRRIRLLPYSSTATTYPLIGFIQNHEIELDSEHFDKAYVHSSILVNNLSAFSVLNQSRCANADSEDDPQIASAIHFLENTHNGKHTRFISGWETRSFATVTENEYYFEQIHLPHAAEKYLLLFAYFHKHRLIPSSQMMPNLLGNLWASTQASNRNWNKELVRIEEI